MWKQQPSGDVIDVVHHMESWHRLNTVELVCSSAIPKPIILDTYAKHALKCRKIIYWIRDVFTLNIWYTIQKFDSKNSLRKWLFIRTSITNRKHLFISINIPFTTSSYGAWSILEISDLTLASVSHTSPETGFSPLKSDRKLGHLREAD